MGGREGLSQFVIHSNPLDGADFGTDLFRGATTG